MNSWYEFKGKLLSPALINLKVCRTSSQRGENRFLEIAHLQLYSTEAENSEMNRPKVQPKLFLWRAHWGWIFEPNYYATSNTLLRLDRWDRAICTHLKRLPSWPFLAPLPACQATVAFIFFIPSFLLSVRKN